MMHDQKAKEQFCQSGFRSISWKSVLFMSLAFVVFLLVLYFAG